MAAEVRKRILPLAWVALFAAFAAALLAFYGSFFSELHLPGSPLNTARKQPGLADSNRGAIAFAAYFLPFGLGLAASFLGGKAMRMIDPSGRTHSGNRHCVFAIMIGGLAAVVSGCMIFAVYVWPHVPALYEN